MLKIGEFSKLSHLTVKALRFYEKEGLLLPVSTDAWTGYRYYETGQLEDAARIRALRQLDLSIEEVKAVLKGKETETILKEKVKALEVQKKEIAVRLSIINHILENKTMNYQTTTKTIPAMIVYSAEARLPHYSDMMAFIPALGEECRKLNPTLKCSNPPYEFCEYLDGEHREQDVLIRHSEAVEEMGKENERIKFRRIPETKVLSIFHKGAYDEIGEAYAYLYQFAEENGYRTAGLSRECYIDGIWNKENVEDWLTEIQLPIL